MTGPLFLDIVFTGLPTSPRPGIEVWADGMGTLPGGIANLAVSTARLGLRTQLATVFGRDAYGTWCAEVLADEGIDLTPSRETDIHTNVTVSYAHAGDRTMITHGHPLPVSADELLTQLPRARAVAMDLTAARAGEQWWRTAANRGAKVFADIGYDPAETWDPALLDPLEHCYAFAPNELEALAYTRTASVDEALAALGERVPLAVVTRGEKGALAVKNGTMSRVPALTANAIDPTGAGDVFISGLIAAELSGLELADQLAFATLCSSLAVRQFGGSLAAPGWGDIADWWTGTTRGGAKENRERYAFLEDLIPVDCCAQVRRAEATIAAHSDLANGTNPG